MMRYIFCIFSGVFLSLGFNQILDREVQEFGLKTGKTEIQSYTKSNNGISISDTELSYQEVQTAARNKGYHREIGDMILGNTISCQNIAPAKTLKLNSAIASLQILSYLNHPLYTKSKKNFSFDTNPTKYSYRYYIYALGRILI